MIEIRHDEINEKYTTRDAYNEIYSGEGILHHDSLYLWLIDLLKPQPGKTLMDIACGEGRLVVLAQKKGLEAMGTDFAIQGLRRGIKEAPTAGWFTADGECLPVKDHTIDYVTHIGSLEHYNDPIQGAKEICRVLKQGGKACILLPNLFGIYGNIQYAVRHGDVFDDGQPLQRYATRKGWEHVLSSAGLRVYAVVGYNSAFRPLTAQDWSWWLKRPRKVIKYLISLIIPVNLANHLVYLCTYDD